MYETMYEAHGSAWPRRRSACSKRIFTYDVGEGPHVIINPEIVETSGEWVYDEGCLSVPGMHFEIVRPKVVTMRGIDLDGNEVVIEGDELLARLFQHEIDHLDGVLLLDRLEPDVRKRGAAGDPRAGPRDHPAGRRPGSLIAARPRCASSSSARPSTRSRRCAPSSTRATRSPSSSPSPTGGAAAEAATTRAR